MVSLEKVKEILNTLPIGYYLGRKILLTIDNSMESYYDSFNDTINIGYQLLPCANEDYDASVEEVEIDIRCMLYHEISHVLVTPKNLYTFNKEYVARHLEELNKDYSNRFRKLSNNDSHAILNVFEDERIETIFGAYFLNVDFKANVRKVNHYEGWVEPKDTMQAFYQIVRYNEGPKEFVEKVFRIIKDNLEISYVENYIVEVMNLYFKIEDYYKTETTPTEEKEALSPKVAFGDGTKGDSVDGKISMPDNTEFEESEKSEETPKSKTAITEKEIEELIEELEEYIKTIKPEKLTPNTYNDYINKSLEKKVNEIIANAKRKKGLSASSYQSYYGKVNPKYIGRKRIETYKWADKSLNGEKSGTSKIQLNLFVDTSGSFSSSETKINQILMALNNLQKKNKDIVCRLVTMGDKNKLEPKLRAVHCCHGNYLLNEIIDIYKQCQGRGNTNYNIVVFDGDAQSFDSWSHDKIIKERKLNEKAWSAWNHPNCVIISDPGNQNEFDKWSPSAKRIYTYNYTSELEDNVIKALKMLIK